MKALFFIETLGLSHKYGIGSYRKYLLSQIANQACFSSIYLVQIGISAKDKVVISYEEDGVITIQLLFSVPGFSSLGAIDFQINEEMAIRCFDILMEKTACENGVVHINMAAQFSLAAVFKSHQFSIVYTHHFSMLTAGDSVDSAMNMTFERQIFGIADQIIFLSDNTRKLAEHFYSIDKRKTNMIMNGVPVKIGGDNRTMKRRIKKELGFRQKDFIFLFVGRITKEKGIYELIHTFSVFAEGRDNVHMIVAGDGEFDVALKIAAGKLANIHFTGFLSTARLLDVYTISDAGILPSYAEQSSFAVLELINYEIPLILSDIPSFKGFKHNTDVLKVKMIKKETDVVGVNLKSMYNNLSLLWQDSATRRRLSGSAKGNLEKRQTAVRMAEGTTIVYKKLFT